MIIMKQNEYGMSLLEVLVSIIVLSIGILGLAPMVVISVNSNSISQDLMTASNLAKEKIEYYTGQEVLPSLPYEEYESDLMDGYERITNLIDNTSDSTLTVGLCQLSIRINWTDNTGSSRSTTYMTYIEKG